MHIAETHRTASYISVLRGDTALELATSLIEFHVAPRSTQEDSEANSLLTQKAEIQQTFSSFHGRQTLTVSQSAHFVIARTKSRRLQLMLLACLCSFTSVCMYCLMCRNCLQRDSGNHMPLNYCSVVVYFPPSFRLLDGVLSFTYSQLDKCFITFSLC